MISNNIPVLSVYCNTPPPQHQLGSAASIRLSLHRMILDVYFKQCLNVKNSRFQSTC